MNNLDDAATVGTDKVKLMLVQGIVDKKTRRRDKVFTLNTKTRVEAFKPSSYAFKVEAQWGVIFTCSTYKQSSRSLSSHSSTYVVET